MQFSTAIIVALAASINAATVEKPSPEVSSALTSAHQQWASTGHSLNQIGTKFAHDNTPSQVASSIAGLTTTIDGSNSALQNVSMSCCFWPVIIHEHPYPVPVPAPGYYPCPPGYGPGGYPYGGGYIHSTSKGKLFPMSFASKPMQHVENSVTSDLKPVLKSVTDNINQAVTKASTFKDDSDVTEEVDRLLSSVDKLHLNTNEFAGLDADRKALYQAAEHLKSVIA